MEEAGRITQLWQQGDAGGAPLFAEMLPGAAAEVICRRNSSLQMMYDQVALAGARASPAGQGPQGKEAAPEFICPVPG